MRNTITNIRWRLLTGVLCLFAVVAVSLPAAASRVDLGQRVADIWPNNAADVAEIIWPNGVLTEVIWPNAPVLGGQLVDSQDSQGENQDGQGGNQHSQN